MENLSIVYGVDDQQLVYRFQFFNDGNAPATDVIVDQFFDGNVDLGSIEIIGTGFDEAYFELNAGGDVSFYFDNINLPGIEQQGNPSEEDCIEWLMFSVCYLDHVVDDGDCIESEIDIYFDQQPAVSTGNVMCGLYDGYFTENLCGPQINTGDLIEVENKLKSKQYYFYHRNVS